MFFPDPWPKARHHKRRLMSPGFADLVGVPARSPEAVGGWPPTGRTTPDQMRERSGRASSSSQRPPAAGRRAGRNDPSPGSNNAVSTPAGASSTLPTDAREPGPAPTRWRLDLRYDGTEFAGWAAQAGLRTVQGELELWLARVLRLAEPVRLVCAGPDRRRRARPRTGGARRPAAAECPVDGRLRPTAARALPDDIAVTARHPCAAAVRRPLRRDLAALLLPDGRRRARVPTRCCGTAVLDLDRELWISRRSTRRAPTWWACATSPPSAGSRPEATTIRTLLELRADRRRGMHAVEFTVRADAFCHSMVRSLVGALVEVGSGRRDRGGWPAWRQPRSARAACRCCPPTA